MVIALAGRRVDAPDATERRFPLSRSVQVRQRIYDVFLAAHASTVVCSAACGADLLALEAARDLNIRARIVLPCGRDLFRKTSVSDRPGDWGERYDEIVSEAANCGDLLELRHNFPDREAYSVTNNAVLREAIRMAEEIGQSVSAVIVWEGKSKGENDYTEQFARAARNLGIMVEEITTL
jgi:hypothetical protein